MDWTEDSDGSLRGRDSASGRAPGGVLLFGLDVVLTVWFAVAL
jgi:hypothetical protein